ncbi:FKBP-type peptidyl-prolyl cis-trans isomerase [Pseudomaricurvus sp. HS19]|uniref:FKBP-type peptidyl-prolyl cis-trans isomerase n=1 Tax=Pseudomaricurvus sp. HS19 TaxID=2692626 RepID=UPI0013721433|nr:FKBP-type peptidyl-prolyl cis-trans isomerase [Pseudomaricurvus sp. HS19]MYM63701.1 hypothetical protein [Pseudomaricurvus sp. HS19]
MSFTRNKISRAVAAAATTLLLAGAVTTSVQAEEMDTVTKRMSYIFGYQVGRSIQEQQIEIDLDIYKQALEDALAGKDPSLTQEEVQEAMMAFQSMQQAKAAKFAEAQQAEAEANLKQGQEFLAANAKKSGVKTTKSGLQYKVLEKGKGSKPTADSTVTVHYRGTLLDGTEFDSSYARGTPIEFGVGQVIPGWTEALQLMTEGSKWELYIPSDLAYGPGGSRPVIGPNETLKFEVELIKVSK